MDWPSQDWKSDIAWMHLCHLLLLSFQGFVPTAFLQLIVSSIYHLKLSKLSFYPLHSIRVFFIFMAKKYSIIIYYFNLMCLYLFQAGTLYFTASFFWTILLENTFSVSFAKYGQLSVIWCRCTQEKYFKFLGFNKCICKICRGVYYQAGQGHNSLTP